MDAEERAAWAIVFNEHAGNGTFDFDEGVWRKPNENPEEQPDG